MKRIVSLLLFMLLGKVKLKNNGGKKEKKEKGNKGV